MTTPTSEALARLLRAEAARLGFVAVGICPADAAPEAGARLRRWLDSGFHGDMLWMERRVEERASPRGLWKEVRSVVMLGFPYTPPVDPLRHAHAPDTGVISVYALGADYHEMIKRQLKALARTLLAQLPAGELKLFVDTAPVMEKPLAEAAGIGWQGKHSNLVSRAHGSWLFLACLYTGFELAPGGEAGAIASCGRCVRCIEACPTRAIVRPHVVDARRCISYLTIEHKGAVPEALRPLLGNRIYGCDDCLAVCPWNRFARAPADPALGVNPSNLAPRLAELLALDDSAFRARFRGSAVKRIGRNRLVRNCLYAAGNSGLAALRPVVARHLADPDPVVAEAARWALARLGSVGA